MVNGRKTITLAVQQDPSVEGQVDEGRHTCDRDYIPGLIT